MNENTPEYLNNILETITENLRESEIRPSLAFHNAPKNFLIEEELEWRVITEDEDSFDDSVCREVLEKYWWLRELDEDIGFIGLIMWSEGTIISSYTYFIGDEQVWDNGYDWRGSLRNCVESSQ